jgi:hypothetical protein
METVTAGAAARLVVKHVLPAVKALGERVWDKVEDTATDQASDVPAGFGRRLLQRLVPHRSESHPQSRELAMREGEVVERVAALAERPDDLKAAILAVAAVETLLARDPALLAAIADLLAAAPKTASAQG